MAARKKIIRVSVLIILVSIFIKLFASYVAFGGFMVGNCIPGHYFVILKTDKKIKDGDIFAFKFKGSTLYPKGTIFVKYVGCSEGEHLYTKDTDIGTAFYCNSKLLGYACNQAKNPKCPAHKNYDLIIPHGYYFAYGTAYKSYDSRYWGLVDAKSVIGKAIRVF